MSAAPVPVPHASESGESLDPEDWEVFTASAHTLLDACIERMAGARHLPWRPLDAQARASLAPPLPLEGKGIEAIAEVLARDVMPYATGNAHPRFFGWVHGAGLPSAFLAEMVAAAMNSNCGGRDHGGIEVERGVIGWCAELFGMPPEAGGLLTTGTSQATLLALCTARHRATKGAARREGIADLPPMRVYAAEGAHACIRKALEVMGHGVAALRSIETEGPAGKMRSDALVSAIRADRSDGILPLAIAGTAGSVNTGAFDDLAGLADIAGAEGIWLHVDGAFGAWARLAEPPWCDLAAGIEHADSLAFDFHKWMSVQYDCGALLLRDAQLLQESFGGRPAYLAEQAAGLGGGAPWPCDLGLELSRGFRALKVWTALQAHGIEAFANTITRNCRQAARLAETIARSPHFRLAAPVVSNVVTFSLRDPRRDRHEIGTLNAGIATDLQLRGEAVFSTTEIDGCTVLRAALVNHRTTDSDIDLAFAALERARVHLCTALA